MVLSEKELKTLIAQRFMIGLPGTSLDEETKRIIKEYKISSFILFSRNIESIKQIKNLCEDIHSYCSEHTGHKAFISIDEEGGVVSRLSNDFAKPPSAMAQAASGYLRNAYLSGKIIAKQLAYCGINLNLAPCADVNSNKQNPVIGVRSYSSIADVAGKMCIEFQRAHSEEGIISCAKHFPGHGDTSVDSHLDLPKSNKSLEELEACELKPFKMLIEAGLPAMLLSHVQYPALDDEGLPASISRNIIQGLLRKKLGFIGLCISDCMEMQAIQKIYGIEQGIDRAFFAGLDIILCSHTASYATEAIDRLYLKLKEASLEDIACAKECYQRILRYKDRIEFKNTDISINRMKISANEIYASAIRKPFSIPHLGEKPIVFACNPFVTTLVNNPSIKGISFAKSMSKYFGCESYVFTSDPKLSEIRSLCRSAEDASCIVFASYNAHIKIGQLKLYEHLKKLNKPIIFFAMRNPYDLDFDKHKENIAKIAMYEYSQRSIDLAIKILEENEDARYDG